MFLLRTLIQGTIYGVVAAGVIFGLAGRWDVWNVWAYAGILVVLLSFQTLVVYRKSPDLLEERISPVTRGRVGWSGIPTFLVVSILHWSIAGLDQRFHWSDSVPLAGVVAGLVIFTIGWGLITWVMLVNPFYSATVRIQADRGQRVISDGLMPSCGIQVIQASYCPWSLAGWLSIRCSQLSR